MSQTIQTQNHQDLEYRYVESVIQELKHHGYDVISNPSSEDLPFDLGHYHPALLASKDGGGIVIEVRKSAARLSVDRLQNVATTIAEHDGWQFRLLTLKDIPEYAIGGAEKFPSWSNLKDKIKVAETLIQNEMKEPAILYLWSIFESMLRKQAIAQHLPIDGYQTNKLFKHMYSSGEISIDTFDFFESLYPIRNKIVHGITTPIEPRALNEALRIAQALFNEWNVDTD